jgi:hypothetical protein
LGFSPSTEGEGWGHIQVDAVLKAELSENVGVAVVRLAIEDFVTAEG